MGLPRSCDRPYGESHCHSSREVLMEHDPLGVDPETMRRLGYQTVDWLVDRAQGRCDEPVLRQATPETIAAQVPQAIPTSGQELGRILDHLGTKVLPYRSRID